MVRRFEADLKQLSTSMSAEIVRWKRLATSAVPDTMIATLQEVLGLKFTELDSAAGPAQG